MKTLHIKSLPLKEVIYGLAQEFNTSVRENCEEYSLNIPVKFGKGKITGINFQQGMGLLLYDCTFNEDLEIKFVVDKIHPLKFLFCEEGDLGHRFENDKEFHTIDKYQNAIIASCEEHAHIIQFSANKRTCINSLEINREKFQPSMDCELKSLSKGLEALFRDVAAKNVYYKNGNYCLNLADLLKEIDDYPNPNFVRNLFLHSLAFKILTLQILQYQDDKSKPANQSILRKFEVNSIREAATIINNNILDFISVQELAETVGLNTNKLQDGFKNLYNSTVNGYVQNSRLDLAKNLLIDSEITISEIVYMIGLSSKSYFSKIFKDKYQLSPSTIRKNSRHSIHSDRSK